MQIRFIVKETAFFTVKSSATESEISIRYEAAYKDNLRRVTGVWKLE